MDDKPIIIKIGPVESWNITALRFACKKNKIKGYTKMDRLQLIEAVKQIIDNFKK